MLRKCPSCNMTLQYTINDRNDWTYLICPKCRENFTDERYVTISERISQGYKKYDNINDNIAYDLHERFILNNEDED